MTTMRKCIYKAYLYRGSTIEVVINMDHYSGLSISQAKQQIVEDLNRKLGHMLVRTVVYQRDIV